ncbi:MAG TPA: LD-carboxypeptidase [Chitinophagaceae bacterium]|nr:LD-carboxypeptidase [Chitinophagaceae bacterium]
MVKLPPYLDRGDTIGIVCPAGYMAFEKAERCIQILQSWGFKVKIGNTLGGNSTNYFSGTDEERLADFQGMLDDEEVKAILCARGGYGIGRIIDQIRFKKFRKHPKWIIGYSDVTVLHAHIYSNYRISSLHAPMAAAFNDGENEYVQSIKLALTGSLARYETRPHHFNKIGKAKGELIGGNLALLAHLSGTSSDFKTKNRILFIEDIGEYLYNIDRMLYQLKRNGKFNKLAGLIIGGFSDGKDTERPFGITTDEIIQDVISDFEFPVAFGFPVSHERENYALKIGVNYTLDIDSETVTLKEH